MMWWFGDWSWGGWLAMVLSMVLFWGLVGGLIVVVARSLFAPPAPHGQPPQTAEEMLARRFALGEIDVDEYQARLKALSTTRTGNGLPSR